jgi:hypothetical protein
MLILNFSVFSFTDLVSEIEFGNISLENEQESG